MKREEYLDPNADHFRRLARASLAQDGQPCPNTPPEGHTWKSYWNETNRERARRWFDENFCPRCRKNPIEPKIGEKVCIYCTYQEQGASMFVGDPVQFQGYIFRIDGFGRAHVIPDPLPDHFDWLVFHNVDAAKAFLRKKGASR